MSYRAVKVLGYVQLNPGCTAAEIDRATNTYYGMQNHAHHVTYDAVKRLVRKGTLRVEREGSRNKLYEVTR